MTEPQPDDMVHQAFFGWSHDTGELTVLSHSFSRPELARLWLRRLQAHLRLQPVPGTELPPNALSYFCYDDGSVAILRRFNIGYSPGRNNSHALIGSAKALGVQFALALGEWGGWRPRPRPGGMPTIHVSFLPNPQEVAAKRLHPQAERLEQPLGTVLTQILDHPSAPLSVIGCRDEDRLAMVWGLREAADDYLRRRGSYPRSWSFSTYEDGYDVSVVGLPEIVFLPARQEGAAVARRAIVDLDRLPSPGPNAEIASELVASFLQGRAPRIQEPVLEQVAGHSGAGTHEEAFTTAPAAASSTVAAAAPQPAASPQPPADRESLAAVLRSGSVPEFVTKLWTLKKQMRYFENRTKLRSALDVRAADALAELVELSSREEMFGCLLEALYGPGFVDLENPSALGHAEKLGKNCQSTQLAMMLAGGGEAAWRDKPKIRGDDVRRQDRDDGGATARRIKSKMRDIALERWAADRSVSSIPTGRIAKISQLARRSVYLRGAVVIAAAALLTVMFLLGQWSVPAQTTSVAPGNTTSSAPAPVTTTSTVLPTPQGLLGIGTVTINPIEGRQVFGFVKGEDKKYYPQSVCSPVVGVVDTWTCQISNPLPSGTDGKGLSLVAIEVPVEEVGELLGKPAGEAIENRPTDWGGADVPVEPVS